MIWKSVIAFSFSGLIGEIAETFTMRTSSNKRSGRHAACVALIIASLGSIPTGLSGGCANNAVRPFGYGDDQVSLGTM
jgi:hypothetical protein